MKVRVRVRGAEEDSRVQSHGRVDQALAPQRPPLSVQRLLGDRSMLLDSLSLLYKLNISALQIPSP